MGALRAIYTTVRNIAIVLLVLAFAPGLPPYTHFPIESISFPPTHELTGPFAPNSLLDNAAHLFSGRLNGPETLRVRDNVLYASTADGLVRIDGDEITPLGRIGPDCEPHDLATCGMSAGFDFDTQHPNTIILADAYYGLWSIDLDTQRKTQLVGAGQVLPGDIERPAKLFNSVTVSARTGDIYWTDSTSDFNVAEGLSAFIANPSGRLFRYERSTGRNHVLADRLHFANGLVLAADESFVLVSETAASRVRRVFIAGARAGQSDVFVAALPGAPDNLCADEDGVWVALACVFDADQPAGFQLAGPLPAVRRAVVRVFALLRLTLRAVADVWPQVGWPQRAANWVGSFEMMEALGGEPAVRRSIVVRLSWTGEIVGVAQGTDGSSVTVTHAVPAGDVLYLGSFANDYVGRVPLPVMGMDVK